MSENISDILLRSVSSQNYLGQGRHASAFALDLPNAEGDYVLRLDNSFVHNNRGEISRTRSLHDFLTNTSSLTLRPPEQVMNQRNYGQPLLHTSDAVFSIHMRQKGETITNVKKAYRQTLSNSNHSVDMTNLMFLNDLNKLSETSIEQTLETLYNAFRNGADADASTPNNLLFSKEHGLRPIDLHYKSFVPASFINTSPTLSSEEAMYLSKRALLRMLDVTKRYSKETPSPTPWEIAFKNQSQTFLCTVERAATSVLERVEGEGKFTPAFTDTSRIDAVAITAPPHALLEKLREVEHSVNITRA